MKSPSFMHAHKTLHLYALFTQLVKLLCCSVQVSNCFLMQKQGDQAVFCTKVKREIQKIFI